MRFRGIERGAFLRAAAAALGATLLLAPANARAESSDDSPWRFELQPYGWVPVRVTGNATIPTPPALSELGPSLTVPVDLTISDLLHKLQIAAQLKGELWYRRVGIIYNGSYVRTGSKTTVRQLAIDLTNQLFVQDIRLGLRLLDRPLGGGEAGPRLGFELHGGARVDWIRLDADVGQASLGRQRTDVKGLVGGRIPLRLSRSWLVGVRGLVALPGPTWQVLGELEWDPTDLFALKLGYQVADFRAGKDERKLDLFAHGPYIAFGFRFGGPVF